MTEIPAVIILPQRYGDPVQYRLTTDLQIGGQRVPSGFVTDGATVPRWFWPLYPPVDRYMPAAILHDWLLIEGRGWRVANDAFRGALRDLNIPGWRAAPMIAAVRVRAWWCVMFLGEPA